MDAPRRIVCAAFWLLLLGTDALSAEEIDRGLRDRFLASVKETERRLERLSFEVKCEFTTQFVWMSDAVLADAPELRKRRLQPRTEEFEFALSRGFILQRTGIGPGELETVLGMNDQYAFHIQRSPPVKQYSLAFLEPLDSNRLEDPRVRQVVHQARVLPLCAWMVVGLTVPELVDSPYFSITKVFSVPPEQSNGPQLVRIEFDHLVDDPSRKRAESMSDAYMICDPSRSWALMEYCLTMWDGATYHVTIDFGEVVDGIPFPKKMLRVIHAENVSTRQAVATFEVISDDVPEEEFYLSHYGLPEPNFGRTWFGAWVWYLIAGIVCLVVSAMILKRRRATG